MNKSALRKQYLSKRQQFTAQELQTINSSIVQQFFNHFQLEKISALHIFLPIIKQNEINTWLIINKIRQFYPHITLITSKSDFQVNQMQSYVLAKQTKIVENKLGIPEPVNAIKYADNKIDMILIPLLCFDQQGFRVGYGKGFYDRFLQKCKPNIIKIGLSLFAPVNQINDINDYDIKMDFCIMQHQVWQRTFKTKNTEFNTK